MSDKGAFARLIITSTMCVLITIASCCNFLVLNTDSPSLKYTSKEKASETTETNQKKNVSKSTKSSSENKTVSSANTSSSASAVAAASSGTVLGKVVDKFITPYTANTSYNNVYLKNSTGLNIDIKSLLSSPLPYKIEKNGKPQVLIVHTHATESFLTENRDYYTDKDVTRSTEESKNMVNLGNIVAKKLNDAGIKTIHDKTLHDYPTYNDSYTRAAKTITSTVKKYPSIKIVLDLHRDAMAISDTDKVKITTEINGKKAAQVMLVMGSQSGDVKNFPNWQENLKLAVRLQQTLEAMYPTLARSISFLSRNYNESLTTGSMLIEIGTDGNSIDEVEYSAELLGNALKSLLNTLG